MENQRPFPILFPHFYVIHENLTKPCTLSEVHILYSCPQRHGWHHSNSYYHLRKQTMTLWQKAKVDIMANLKGCMMHNTDHWATPSELYHYYMVELGCIDPCPLHSKKNNLEEKYKGELIFINPPYSDIKSWVKFIKNNYKDNIIFLLIPARTDTKYFHELIKIKPLIQFIKGRLKFNDTGCAPFPSIIMTFYENSRATYAPYNRYENIRTN